MNKKDRNVTDIPKLARQWLNSGRFFKWTSASEENKSFGELNIFSVQKGDGKKPPILMIHGYPTSSFDFMELFDLLSMDYFVCALDTQGYGFSDKPRNGYKYSVEDDARLVNYYINEVLNVRKLTVVTHDKANSVGLALLDLYKNQDRSYPYKRKHLPTAGQPYRFPKNPPKPPHWSRGNQVCYWKNTG